MKQKLEEKYLPDSYKRRLLDKLHSFRQGSMSIQEYTTDFDDLILRCEVQEDSYQAVSRYRSGLRSDIQRAMFIHSREIETLKKASQLAQDIETSLRFSTECTTIPKAGEQPNPNNNTTKDTKVKSVIGESFRSAKVVNVLSIRLWSHCCTVSSRSLPIKETNDDEIKTIVHEANRQCN